VIPLPLVAIALTVCVWVLLYFILPNTAVSWDMDFGGEPKSFLFLHGLYAMIFRQVYWVSAVACGAMLWRGEIMAAEMFGTTAFYAVVFQLWLTNRYETYLQRKYRKDVTTPPYPTGPYAFTISLGVSTFIFFAMAIGSAVAAWK